MKLGIVIGTNEAEVVWNAFRFENTSLKARHKEGSNACPISTMKDLLKLIEESDKILTLG